VSDSDDDRIIAYLAGEPAESLTPSERAELDELRALLGAEETWGDPDPALEDSIVAAIAAEATGRPSSAEPSKPRRSWVERLGLSRRTYAFAGAALAAAAVIAVIVGLSVGRSGPSSAPRFAMVVSGTPLAPGAHGSATLTKTTSGWRIELKATGLPHLANGRYYQAWLKNAAGILVPVGTFNDARDVTLWSGAPVTQFRAFSVTVQQANGDPRSSGRRVLTGVAHPVG
jgi:Anti-sigma-K factor rskA, C-terminal